MCVAPALEQTLFPGKGGARGSRDAHGRAGHGMTSVCARSPVGTSGSPVACTALLGAAHRPRGMKGRAGSGPNGLLRWWFQLKMVFGNTCACGEVGREIRVPSQGCWCIPPSAFAPLIARLGGFLPAPCHPKIHTLSPRAWGPPSGSPTLLPYFSLPVPSSTIPLGSGDHLPCPPRSRCEKSHRPDGGRCLDPFEFKPLLFGGC